MMENVGDDMKKIMYKKNFSAEYQKLMHQALTDPSVQTFLTEHQDELSEEEIERSSSKLYEYVNEKNKLENGQSNVASGYEPELVVTDHLIDVTYKPTHQLVQKRKKQEFSKRIKSISMPKNIKDASLSDYYQDQGRAKALEDALDFISSYEAEPDKFHKGLYLYGPFGVGKTYLLGAIANRLAEDGFSSALIHFPSFAVEMKNSIGSNQVEAKLNEIKKAPVLMVDDIGADSMSSWVRDDIFGVILEYRMQNELPTFFSSNFSMQQFESEHLKTNSQGDVEPLKAKRLMERIKFLSEPVEVKGENLRNK